MINYSFNPFDKTERSMTMTLIDLLNRDEFEKEIDATVSPKNDDVQIKETKDTRCPSKEIEKEQELSLDGSIAQNIHGVNIPDMFTAGVAVDPPVEDVLIEIGLTGFANEGEPASALKPACKGTFEKWYAILGYDDFKATILAIHSSDLKNGLKWHRLFVKDVCYFVHYFHSRRYFVDFDILSKCLGSYRNGRPISPKVILSNITQNNVGDTVLALYNSWKKDDPLPKINEKERRRELH